MSARSFRLQPQSGDVRRARELCATVAQEAYGPGCDDLVDGAEMVASELVTNAIRAGATTVVLQLDAGPSGLRIAVSDDADGHVTPRLPRAFDTSGRGLHIVGAIASQWGVEAAPPGKCVWADLRAPSPSFAESLSDVAS